MSRPPGLLAYLSLTALTAPAQRRRLAGRIARGGAAAAREAERLGRASQPRPDGPLVWLHASGPAQEAALADLARRIGESGADTAILLTGEGDFARPGALPPGAIHQYVPEEAGGPVAAFLDHWRPDLAVWAGIELRPALIHAAADRGIPLGLIDAAAAPSDDRGWRRIAGLTAATLRRFTTVLATDAGAAQALRDAGAGTVDVTGPLEEEAATLPCNMRERDGIGEVLKARPVWVAAAVTGAEEEAVIAAHRAAARLAHRLLLILVPADPERGPALAERIAETGLSTALRSVEGEPEGGTEVFIADSEGELGLWYRLAPVAFMAGTLAPGAGGGRSPLEPAALGSAILHGPETGPHAAIYGRFLAAGAARGVADSDELGAALSELLSPDRAAAMAHAAWRVSTGGAETSARVLEIIAATLGRRAGG